jgi:hypothetical protein
MSHRTKLEAARTLAELGATEGERDAARAAVKRLEARYGHPDIYPHGGFRAVFSSFTAEENALTAKFFFQKCECGTRFPRGSSCPNTTRHAEIDIEKRKRFPRGSRVYYNCWAYAANCTGKVIGYTHEWNWIRIKFYHLKSSRNVPIYSEKGWHLSTEPVDPEILRAMNLREGMEAFESFAKASEDFGEVFRKVEEAMDRACRDVLREDT